jgi:hypothetical protein
MAKNTHKNTRKGIIKNRSQYYNSKTKLYIKKDNTTGKILSCKSTPYKSIALKNKAKK